ncbi:hypothetical protein J3A83DRAFT_4189739 [Scleroderma citrinum]
MLLLPQGDQEMVEGMSDPVVLQGIDKSEFEGSPVQSGLNQERWISGFKLSTIREFRALRIAAIKHLDTLSDVDKIVLAIKYEIKEWMLPALLKLARRPPIGIEGGSRMGFENALKLPAVQEKVKLEYGTRNQCTCPRGRRQEVPVQPYLAVGDRDPTT